MYRECSDTATQALQWLSTLRYAERAARGDVDSGSDSEAVTDKVTDKHRKRTRATKSKLLKPNKRAVSSAG
jgi:hypothetical protein